MVGPTEAGGTTAAGATAVVGEVVVTSEDGNHVFFAPSPEGLNLVSIFLNFALSVELCLSFEFARQSCDLAETTRLSLREEVLMTSSS
jgi:hypothetical protein